MNANTNSGLLFRSNRSSGLGSFDVSESRLESTTGNALPDVTPAERRERVAEHIRQLVKDADIPEGNIRALRALPSQIAAVEQRTAVAASAVADLAGMEQDAQRALEEAQKSAEPQAIDAIIKHREGIASAKARLSVINEKLTEARSVHSEASAEMRGLENQRNAEILGAWQRISQSIIPATKTPLSDLDLANAFWAIDRAALPETDYAAFTLPAFIEKKFVLQGHADFVTDAKQALLHAVTEAEVLSDGD